MLCILFVYTYNGLWNKNRIVLDSPSYYTYLPASIVYHDLHLNFVDKNPSFFRDKIWFYGIENGKRLIKHPIGWSFCLLPFYLTAHFYCSLGFAQANGYSMPYQNALSLGLLCYLLLGLYFLRKFLLCYFSDLAVATVLIAITLGSNLLWYSSFEGFMPHCLSFSLLCAVLYFFNDWLCNNRLKSLLLFCFLFALMVLIRPLAITSLVYFFIWATVEKKGFKPLLDFVKPNNKGIIKGSLIFIIITSLQLIYWKYATGKWLYDVYINEHFTFLHPKMFDFLFSYRKGVLVYTPIFWLAIPGFVLLYKKMKAQFYASTLILMISVYLLSSWWAWSYGICWAMRPMIDYYPLLSIPMALFLNEIFSKKKLIKISLLSIISILVLWQWFQTWQYKNGLIHYDDMSKESYWSGFFQTEKTNQWIDLLEPYNWQRRINGLPEIELNKKHFYHLKANDTIWIRAKNLKYLSVNEKAQNMIAAYKDYIGSSEHFFIKQLQHDTVAICNRYGNYFSVKENFQQTVMGSEKEIGVSEKFLISFVDENKNKIQFKAFNNLYLKADETFPYLLKANGTAVDDGTVFRYFSNQ
jgi:hypothetical protein